MNRLGIARKALAVALEAVLPGRTSAHPPAGYRYVAPFIYIEQPFVNRATLGRGTQISVATFPVWIVYDGTDSAQVDGLDDVVSNAWDAVTAVRNAEPQAVRADDVAQSPGSERRLRAAVMSVEVTLTAVSLCLPTPATSQIPSEPVPQEITHG